mmetsp:Transcript_8727/g.26879  ORF Transcript_8727/g.26879 Transcript_8727/m.26879 type:complete len:309 (-) Transcript_8727:99-1025(-)
MAAPSTALCSATGSCIARLLLLPLLLLSLLKAPGVSSEWLENEEAEDEEGEAAGLLQVARQPYPPPTSSPLDIRTEVPACFQDKAEWCWATTLAEVAGFYNDSFVTYGKFGRQAFYWDTFWSKAVHYSCFSVECYITGFVRNETEPYACCPPSPLSTRNSEECWWKIGYPNDMINALAKLVGVHFTATTWKGNGVLSQADLDKVIAKQQPIILEIEWCAGSWHYVTLAGSNGQGKYYLHDPNYVPTDLSVFESELVLGYQELTYDEVVQYTQPGPHSAGQGRWKWTAYISDPDLVEVSSKPLQPAPPC